MSNVNTFNYEAFAKDTMKRIGLSGWEYKLNKRLTSTLGRARRSSDGRKTIEISNSYLENAPHESIIDTILHEIAHAAAWDFDRHWGHGVPWKKWCKVLGCNPSPYKNLGEELHNKINKPRYEIVVIVEDMGHQAKVERTGVTSKRRTNLTGRALVGRPDTRYRLGWLDTKTNILTRYS